MLSFESDNFLENLSHSTSEQNLAEYIAFFFNSKENYFPLLCLGFPERTSWLACVMYCRVMKGHNYPAWVSSLPLKKLTTK